MIAPYGFHVYSIKAFRILSKNLEELKESLLEGRIYSHLLASHEQRSHEPAAVALPVGTELWAAETTPCGPLARCRLQLVDSS